MKKIKKSSTPMVSVSLICYNQEKYISKAIDSVLMQKTKFDYEIVLSDDQQMTQQRYAKNMQKNILILLD